MTNEDKFKNKVKDLLDENQYAYDASNWELASTTLDEEDKRKKRRFFYMLFSGAGLALLVTGYLLLSGSLLLKKETIAEKKEQPAAPVITPEAKSSSNTLANKIANTYNENSNETVSQAKNKIRTENVGPVMEKPVTAKTRLLASTPVTAPKTIQRQEPVQASIASALITPKDVQSLSGQKNNGPEEAPKAPETGIPQHSGSAEAPAALAQQGTHALPELPVKPLQEDHFEKAKMPTAIDPIAKTGEEDYAKTKPLQIADTIATPLATSSPVDSLPGAASQPTLQNTPEKNNFLYIEAGSFFNSGWRYKGNREGMGVNVYLGLSYLSKLSNKTAFSIGVCYTTLSGLKQGSREVRSSKVVFGEQTDVIAITPSTLNYILIPVKLHFLINEKQSLTFGYTAGYLLDVQSSVKTYTERLNAQVDQQTYHTGGYVEGFKTFSSQLSLGYRRQLYQHLWINGELFYGLTDLRDNTFFGINVHERMTGLKISLTYDLLKK